MSVELTPLGVACNLSCPYCYQHPMRDAGNVGNKTEYDFDKMFAALDQEGSDFLVFGGEPLLVPIADLRRIFEYGFGKHKKNGIQTNGVLITPAHVELFKEFNVHVGLSMDGPDELNDSRWAGTLERTRESTLKSHANMKACIAAGVNTSVIITLYKGNALPDVLPRLKQWIRELDTMGSRGVRIHLLEVDHRLVREKMQLTQDQTITALRELVELDKELTKSVMVAECRTQEEAQAKLVTVLGQYRRLYVYERTDKHDKRPEKFVVWSQGLELDILTDMRKLLRADDDSVTCIWNVCDSYTTSAVRGIDGQGNKSNCGRTNKDGIGRLKAERSGYERQVALFQTPQENGGCAKCRFFLMCKGQCPGTAIDGDWRNRTADCKIWMSLFETLEAELVAKGELPLSLNHDVRAVLETAMINLWSSGQSTSLKSALVQIKLGKSVRGYAYDGDHGDSEHGDAHGDHTDTNGTGVMVAQEDHGDVPHGDAHGDHTDHALVVIQEPPPQEHGDIPHGDEHGDSNA